MKIFQIIFIFLVAALGYCQPGVKVRVNKAGKDFIREMLENLTIGYQFPNYTYQRNDGLSTYSEANFTGLSVSYFDIETVKLEQSRSNQININVIRSNLSLEGNYEIALLTSAATAKNSGTIKFNDNGVSAEMILTLNVLENGKTSINLFQCLIDFVIDPNHAEVENWDSKYKREFNFFLKEHLNTSIVNQFCNDLLQPLVNQLNQLLSTGQGGVFMITPGLFFNASLYEAPVVTTTMMKIKLDGTFFSAEQPNISFSYSRPPLPKFANSQSMAQVAIGIHVLRSLLHSVVEANLVDIPISSDAIPAIGPISLNPQSFNNLISTYTTFLNNRNLSMRLQMTEVPQIQLSDGLVSLNGSIKLATYAVNDDGTQDLAAVFSLIVNASARLSITNNSHICLEFSELCTRFFAEPNAPAGKPNDLVFMNCSHKQAPSFAVPLENQSSARFVKIPLPSIFGYSLSDVKFNIIEDAVILSLNIIKSTQPPQNINFFSVFNSILGNMNILQ